MSALLSKIVSAIMAVVTFISMGIAKLDTNNYRKMIVNAFESYLHPTTSDCIDKYIQKSGGIVKGVCHPNGNYQQIKDANIQWVRFDMPMPFDSNGNVSPVYNYYKNIVKGYADNGIKVMLITPYPYDFLGIGIDPRTDEGKAFIRKTAQFYATDLEGIAAAFQVSNEMGVEHFTSPLTLDEAAEFVGIQLEAMRQVNKDVIVGFNLGNVTMYNFCNSMKPYLQYCDYVGIDIYLGCFENVFKVLYVYDLMLRYAWNFTHKPIMVNEFGYISGGEQKTAEEKQAILQKYGYNSEAEAKADIRNFISKLPPYFQSYLTKLDAYGDDTAIGNRIFDTEIVNHVYEEIQPGYRLINYPHTPDGQADCLRDSVEHFKNLDFVCGAFVYCYSDSSSCYICGQEDCPVETKWGLVDRNGNPKPSYYAIQEAYANWNK